MSAVSSPPGAATRRFLRRRRESGPPGAAEGGWRALLWPPLIVALLLLVLPQALFVWMSLHRNLGMGRISDALTLENYWRILSDDLYRRSLWLTFRLAAATALLDVVIALPTAYLLSRLRSRWFSALVVLLLISSFVSVVIRVLGLTIILGKEGPINRLLLGLGLLDAPLQLYSNPLGVLIGLVQFTLPIVTMLQVGILQTIPPSLEEAGEIHGARWLSVLGRVVLPLARPGLVAGGMIAFNMSMGAFTAAILLGGGVTITFPVLIQSKILHDVDYAMAAALSTFLVAVVFLINLGTALLLKPRRRAAAYAA